jgi:hypothetical protein
MPKRIDPKAQHELERMALDPVSRHWEPVQVSAELEEKLGVAAPSERTVQRKWKRLVESERWALRPVDTDPGFTLRALAWLDSNLPGTAPGRPLLSIDEVAWLRVVHAARPDMEPEAALRIANAYRVSEEMGARGGSDLAEQISIRLGGEGSGAEIAQRVMELFPAWSRP